MRASRALTARNRTTATAISGSNRRRVIGRSIPGTAREGLDRCSVTRGGSDESSDIAELDREAGTRGPCVIRQDIGLPAEFGHLVRTLIENDYMNAEVVRFDGGIRFQPK